LFPACDRGFFSAAEPIEFALFETAIGGFDGRPDLVMNLSAGTDPDYVGHGVIGLEMPHGGGYRSLFVLLGLGGE
jgi:hypothetical protein